MIPYSEGGRYQLAMLLEYAQRPFERMKHRLSNLQGVASI
jgi:hypothetical protein